MSTQGLQQALARIYTDNRVREAFLGGNEAPLSPYDLSPDDLRHLRELRESSAERLEFFSTLLTKKQDNLIRTLLPLTFRALGESFWGQAWSTYVSTFSAEATMSRAAKAISFLDFLESYVGQHSLPNLLEKDIILYERCKLSMHSAFQTDHCFDLVVQSSSNELDDSYPLVHRPFLIRPFNYDLTKIITLLNNSASLGRPQPTPTLILFYRHRQTGSINTAKVASWLEGLLDLCDGQTPATAIAEWLDKRLGTEQSPSACARLLHRLEQQGLLSLLSQSMSPGAGGNG